MNKIMIEQTLSIIKPDAIERNLENNIKNSIYNILELLFITLNICFN